MVMRYSFPQKISLRIPDLQKSLKTLTEERNRVNGYFNQLLETWGENKETYTVDSFFDVFVQFYDQFMGELNLLEKKKQEREAKQKKEKKVGQMIMVDGVDELVIW